MAAQLQAIGIPPPPRATRPPRCSDWANDPTKGPDAFIDGNNGPDGGSPYMWGHVFWDKTGGINYFLCDDPKVDALLNEAVTTGDDDTYVKAGEMYSATGCYMNFSYNKDWVVAQKWLTNVPESHNIGANELELQQARHRPVVVRRSRSMGPAAPAAGLAAPPTTAASPRARSERALPADAYLTTMSNPKRGSGQAMTASTADQN